MAAAGRLITLAKRPYEVEISAAAARALRKFDKATQLRLGHQIDLLALNPRPHGVKKLRDTHDLYRLRSGDYRIIYSIQDRVLLVLVVAIGHRRDVYER